MKLTLIFCHQVFGFKGIWLFLYWKGVGYDLMSKFPISSKTTFSNKWSSSEHTKNLKCVCTLKVIWLCDMISTEACDTRQPSLWPAKHNNHLNFHVLFISHTQVLRNSSLLFIWSNSSKDISQLMQFHEIYFNENVTKTCVFSRKWM